MEKLGTCSEKAANEVVTETKEITMKTRMIFLDLMNDSHHPQVCLEGPALQELQLLGNFVRVWWGTAVHKILFLSFQSSIGEFQLGDSVKVSKTQTQPWNRENFGK